mgnify:CR=1 FL=1
MSASPRKEFIYGNKKEKSAFTCQACEITTEEKNKSVLNVNDLFPNDEGDSDNETEEPDKKRKEE